MAVSFDFKVTLGNIISIVAFLLAALIGYLNLQAQVEKNTDDIAANSRVVTSISRLEKRQDAMLIYLKLIAKEQGVDVDVNSSNRGN